MLLISQVTAGEDSFGKFGGLHLPFSSHEEASRGAVAQSVERPLKFSVWSKSTDVGSNNERDFLHLSLTSKEAK